MKVFGIIPARYASTRFPGKPLAMLRDKSMIEWVYRRSAGTFRYIAVATDDERIAGEVERFGGKVVMTSPAHGSGTDRCAEALCRMQDMFGEQADVAVNIQGDEPFVDPALPARLASCFEDASIHIATVVRAIDRPDDLFDPNCVKAVISVSGHALYFSRSAIPCVRGYEQNQWCGRHTFYRHLGLYAYRADVLLRLTQLKPSLLETAESLEQNRWLENDYRIRVIQTEDESISIDTPEDMERARRWLADHPAYL
ncbi:MAG: 3-deoxy-manno-octulosonate cytidylyltransferase [Bacteroidales bacterium]|nr:3-deoxy-manno-octulosonate cytidylyltransferase [Bacteroidales bacterium]